jgi:hypothetical protein
MESGLREWIPSVVPSPSRHRSHPAKSRGTEGMGDDIGFLLQSANTWKNPKTMVEHHPMTLPERLAIQLLSTLDRYSNMHGYRVHRVSLPPQRLAGLQQQPVTGSFLKKMSRYGDGSQQVNANQPSEQQLSAKHETQNVTYCSYYMQHQHF